MKSLILGLAAPNKLQLWYCPIGQEDRRDPAVSAICEMVGPMEGANDDINGDWDSRGLNQPIVERHERAYRLFCNPARAYAEANYFDGHVSILAWFGVSRNIFQQHEVLLRYQNSHNPRWIVGTTDWLHLGGCQQNNTWSEGSMFVEGLGR